jgi:hypothetical protein
MHLVVTTTAKSPTNAQTSESGPKPSLKIMKRLAASTVKDMEFTLALGRNQLGILSNEAVSASCKQRLR